MATILQLRRGTSTQHASFTGAQGEVTVDTTKKTIVVHDGSTQGGSPLATEAFVTTTLQTADSLAELSGDTDDITEGSTNLFFTNTRARAAFSAGTGISITNGAISTSITQYADSDARAAISVTDSGGDGSLSYNSGTGVITYTGPSASEVRAHFSAGTGISITNGAISTSITQYTDSAARAAISVTDSGGDGSLSYNNTTGVITYTGPSAADVRAHFSAGTGITITSGEVAVDTSTIATKTYADNAATTAVAAVIDSAPAALDTLNELAAALGDDANYSTTVSTALGNRLRVDVDTQNLTSTQQGNALTNLGLTATKTELNYVDGVTSAIQTQLDAKFASADFNSTFDTRLGTKSTTNLTEGTNLYFTNARARSALSGGSGITYDSSTGAISADTTVVATKSYVDTAVAGKDNTDEITEGTTNLYFTTARARGSLSAGSGISYNSTTGAISADTSTMATKSYVDTAVAGKDNTDEITEGSTNLYFTNARARSALSASTGISYNSTTGAISSTITQYTDALARSAVSFTAGSGAYNSTTGVFTIPTNTSHLTNGANFITLTSLSAGTGISYDNTTGVISADTTTVATKTYVDGKISDLVGGASAAYDTLKEIQDAMATDAELSAAIAAITIGNATQTVTAGSYLTGGGSFTANQTTDSSVTLSVDATSANTASKVVARDASGNFSAGTITAALSGNASTATKWATARTITLGGDLTGNVSIDGSGDVTLTATVAANSVALGTDTTGNYVADVTAGNYITKSGTAGEGWSPTIAVDATSANTASKVVARDASGNFSAGTITATLNGNASTVTNGVYTTDTGTVTNAMLAGSIANAKLVNSSITLAGTSVSLGGSFTAQNMLDAIKTVDGAGSGLDADTLDGESSAYFRINIYDSAGTLLN